MRQHPPVGGLRQVVSAAVFRADVFLGNAFLRRQEEIHKIFRKIIELVHLANYRRILDADISQPFTDIDLILLFNAGMVILVVWPDPGQQYRRNMRIAPVFSKPIDKFRT